MELWTLWTQLLQAALAYLGSSFGFSEAVSIIVLTMTTRLALMPISLTAAYRMQQNKRAVERLKPLLEILREQHKDDQAALAKHTMALYREHGISFIDRFTLLNIGTQGVFGLGIFQSLRHMVFGSRFLWIANLGKPDVLLTVLVGALMLLGMMCMPETSSNLSTLLMMVIPVVISVFAIAALPSALGIYWATSNVATLVQNLALRGLLVRQHRMAT